jgi:hypothetical protein
MCLPIPISQDAPEQEVHALVRSVLQLHKDEMQARSLTSIAPHFNIRVTVLIVATNIFLRGQKNKHEAKRPTAWTFYIRETDWETQLHIETSNESTLTSCVS